jgi:nucleoside 2-deoxyribosyltransferase
MKVYVASPYEHKHTVRAICKKLRKAGIQVVSTWHRERLDPDVQVRELFPSTLRKYACRDIQEIDESEALILILPRGKKLFRGGMFVELGYALGQRKLIYLLGEQTNLFLFHPDVYQATSLSEIIEDLVSYD